MALHTLRAMALGGMRDHVGGGFHRYSVDADWRVPHFEKMLYDQAQLALAYLEAAQITRDAFYASVADDTLAYVARDMTDARGGFYSAEDADSIPPEQAGRPDAHKVEGAFYVWSAAELRDLLGDDADVFAERFGIEEGGNAPRTPRASSSARTSSTRAKSMEDVATRTGRAPDDVTAALARARAALFAARADAAPASSRRQGPHRLERVDDRGVCPGRTRPPIGRTRRDTGGAAGHLAVAQRAARFLRDAMWDADRQVLRRRYADGEAAIDGYAEDYAFAIFGLLELFQADGDPGWLDWAGVLQLRQDALFWDAADGGWFSTTGADPERARAPQGGLRRRRARGQLRLGAQPADPRAPHGQPGRRRQGAAHARAVRRAPAGGQGAWCP